MEWNEMDRMEYTIVPSDLTRSMVLDGARNNATVYRDDDQR